MLISAVILAKNEEKNIKDCIGSVKWCDEIVVIDDDSVDKTVEVSKKIGAIVYEHALENDFAAQRNFGLEKARGDWIFFIDADERVSANLAFEVDGPLFVRNIPVRSFQSRSLINNLGPIDSIIFVRFVMDTFYCSVIFFFIYFQFN